jgi:Co/Zn/Cd efflux system component
MQPLGALVNVAIIWMVTAELFVEATKRIFNKAVVEEPLYMLVISIFGLFCNLFIMYILNGDNVSPESINLNTALPSDCFETDQPSNQRRLLRYSNKLKRDELKLIPLEEVGQKKSYDAEPSRFNNNINIKAAYIHIFTDIILSIGVIVSASLIYFFAPSN